MTLPANGYSALGALMDDPEYAAYRYFIQDARSIWSLADVTPCRRSYGVLSAPDAVMGGHRWAPRGPGDQSETGPYLMCAIGAAILGRTVEGGAWTTAHSTYGIDVLAAAALETGFDGDPAEPGDDPVAYELGRKMAAAVNPQASPFELEPPELLDDVAEFRASSADAAQF